MPPLLAGHWQLIFDQTQSDNFARPAVIFADARNKDLIPWLENPVSLSGYCCILKEPDDYE